MLDKRVLNGAEVNYGGRRWREREREHTFTGASERIFNIKFLEKSEDFDF